MSTSDEDNAVEDPDFQARSSSESSTNYSSDVSNNTTPEKTDFQMKTSDIPGEIL